LRIPLKVPLGPMPWGKVAFGVLALPIETADIDVLWCGSPERDYSSLSTSGRRHVFTPCLAISEPNPRPRLTVIFGGAKQSFITACLYREQQEELPIGSYDYTC
jgi:hypothetical protein